MNLEIIIAAGYDTPGKLVDFLMLDNDRQDEIFREAAAASKKVTWVCDLSKREEKSA